MIRDLVYAIQDFVFAHFFHRGFFPFSKSWWVSNVINFLFIIIGFVALFYWLGELKKYNAKGDEPFKYLPLS